MVFGHLDYFVLADFVLDVGVFQTDFFELALQVFLSDLLLMCEVWFHVNFSILMVLWYIS